MSTNQPHQTSRALFLVLRLVLGWASSSTCSFSSPSALHQNTLPLTSVILSTDCDPWLRSTELKTTGKALRRSLCPLPRILRPLLLSHVSLDPFLARYTSKSLKVRRLTLTLQLKDGHEAQTLAETRRGSSRNRNLFFRLRSDYLPAIIPLIYSKHGLIISSFWNTWPSITSAP
jgi:hypothetical protein